MDSSMRRRRFPIEVLVRADERTGVKVKREFGFYPDVLKVDTEAVGIRPFPTLGKAVEEVLASAQVEGGWIYVPPQRTRDFMSGRIRERPFGARVFGMPKSHTLELPKPTGNDHVVFHLWALSFFLGMRLTATEAGFLDATPVKPGKMVVLMLCDRSIERAIDLAEKLWIANRGVRNAQRFAAAVHALFLGQYPQALQFERFMHLYRAIEACLCFDQRVALCARAPRSCRAGGLDVRRTWLVDAALGEHRRGRRFGRVRYPERPAARSAVHERANGICDTRGRHRRENHAVDAGPGVPIEVALIGGKADTYLESPVNWATGTAFV